MARRERAAFCRLNGTHPGDSRPGVVKSFEPTEEVAVRHRQATRSEGGQTVVDLSGISQPQVPVRWPKCVRRVRTRRRPGISPGRLRCDF